MTKVEKYESVTVDLGARSYEIAVGDGLLTRAGELVAKLGFANKVFVITDDKVAEYHLKTVLLALKGAGMEVEEIVLPAGEKTKNFTVLQEVVNSILAHRPERKNAIIALGGGVIGDLSGFAASMVLRGIPFVQVPTTLLAMVDSSVGGKTGINSKQGKNLIGAFYQPSMVIVDTGALDTLPHRQFLAGYAEVVKYGLINDKVFFEWLETHEKLVHDRTLFAEENAEVLVKMIRTSCEAKAKIVAQDEREGGVRALLNLGHTFGHALELATGYSDALFHGEGVAIGMVLAYQLSERLGLAKASEVERVEQHLKNVGLRTRISQLQLDVDAATLVGYMKGDKKVKDGKLVFILAKAIGEAFISDEVTLKEVEALMQDELKVRAA